jgi:hypothetical protein
MLTGLLVFATAILVWITFMDDRDRPDVIVVKKYYQAPKEIEMTELSNLQHANVSSNHHSSGSGST